MIANTAVIGDGDTCTKEAGIAELTKLAESVATYYEKDYCYAELMREMEAYTKYLISRDWPPAPLSIKPTVFAWLGFVLPCRRIAPPFWTGKNFRKVSK